MYRLIADTGGAFVQPALYEAFGLTVVEVSKTGIGDKNSDNNTINIRQQQQRCQNCTVT